jgi:multiple sugar transport system substrate-binding protein
MTVKKRLVALTAMTVAFPMALASCGGGGSSDSPAGTSEVVDNLKVTDYFTDEPTNTVVKGLLNDCGASIGVKITREAVPGDALIGKVLQQASSKTLPDVLMLDNPDVKQIAATGALSPLNELGISAEGYAPGIVDAATMDGKLYAIQPGANTIAIFYNKDILDKAGVQPPKTWDELRSTAKKLTSKGVYGFAFDATNDYEGAWQFLPPMWTNGGDETDLKSPQVAEALTLWKGLVEDGSVSKSAVNWAQGDVNDQFMAGKAAMMLNGPWNIPSIKKAKVNFGVVTFPVRTPDQVPVAPLGGEAWTVPVTGNEARQAKAAELVKCLGSDEKSLQWSKENGIIPSKTSLTDQYLKDAPDMTAFAEQVKTARARTGKLGEKWPETAKVIYTGVQLVLTDQATPADAMAKAGG